MVFVIRVWIISLISAMLLGLTLLSFSLLCGRGGGIARRGGEYVLLQGGYVAVIDQRLGLLLYCMSLTLVMLVLLVVVLTGYVNLSFGTMNPFAVLTRVDPRGRPLIAALNIGLSVCVLIVVVTLVGLIVPICN